MTNPVFKPTFHHVLDDDVIEATTDRRPSMCRDSRTAKLILQETGGDSGTSVYDHLSTIIKRVLEDRPPNVIDYFEDFSRQLREEHYKASDITLQKTFIEPERLLAAQMILPMLKIPPPLDFPRSRADAEETRDEDESDYRDPLIVDVMHLQFFWSLAGYGFPPGQVFMLSCCMRKLTENPMIAKCRFWGQIFGIKKNYYIVEAELTDDEIEKRAMVELKEYEDAKQARQDADARQAELWLQIPDELVPKQPPPSSTEMKPSKERPLPAPLAHTLYKVPKDIPAEPSGTGVNRTAYFVCNRLGDAWTELPPVTPQQLVAARQIRKYMTGDLNAKLWSYPVFPGTERNYLRATIARITAATYVSPVGYYRIGAGNDEEEEDDVDEEGADNDKPTTVDPGYEPVPAMDLLNVHSWVHHRCHILPQGRVNWFNPKDLEDVDEEAEEEEEDDDGEEGDEKEGEPVPEEGPHLLTPCIEDTTNERIPMWTTKMTQRFNPSNAIVVVRSNLWPGAFSFSVERVHDNLYIGWGTKFVTRNYSPMPIPPIEEEYPIGPEVMEIADPTIEEEEAWRLAHEPKAVDEEGMEEEGEVEPEGEEDEANDDDDEE